MSSDERRMKKKVGALQQVIRGASRTSSRVYGDRGRSCKSRAAASTRTSRWKSVGKREFINKLQMETRIIPWWWAIQQCTISNDWLDAAGVPQHSTDS